VPVQSDGDQDRHEAAVRVGFSEAVRDRHHPADRFPGDEKPNEVQQPSIPPKRSILNW
jgi:hypothetical protein